MIFFIYINMGFAEHLEYVTFTKFWKFSTNFSSTFFTISLLYFPYIRYLILFQMFFSLFIFSQSLFCLRYFLLMYLHMVWQFTLSCPICSFFQPLNFKIQMLYFSALQFPFVYFFYSFYFYADSSTVTFIVKIFSFTLDIVIVVALKFLYANFKI